MYNYEKFLDGLYSFQTFTYIDLYQSHEVRESFLVELQDCYSVQYPAELIMAQGVRNHLYDKVSCATTGNALVSLMF